MSQPEPPAQVPAPGPLPGAKFALAILLIINLFNYLDRYLLAGMLPKIAEDPQISPIDDPLSRARQGLLASTFVWSYMGFSVLFGLLGDRVSRWALVGLGVILWSLASGGSGLAMGYLALLATRCLVGVGEAAYGPTAPTLLSDLFPVSSRGLVMAWFYMAIPVGSALGFVLGGVIADAPGLGWRWAFYLVVPPGIILGVICLFLRDPKVGGSDGVTERHVPRMGDYKVLTRIPSYVLNTTAATGMCFAVGGMSYWMPAYIYERETTFVWNAEVRTAAQADPRERVPTAALDAIEAGLPGVPHTFADAADFRTRMRAAMTAGDFREYGPKLLGVARSNDSPTLGGINTLFGGIVAVGGLTATLFGGWLGDRLRTARTGSYFLVSGWGALLGLPPFVLMLYTPFPYAWGLLFLAVFGLFVNTGPSNTILANVVPPSIRASAFALNILIIHALGDAISPWIIGAVADVSSLRVGLLLVSGMIAVSGAVWLIGSPHLDRDTRRAPTRLG